MNSPKDWVLVSKHFIAQDESGKIKAKRTPFNHRYYTKDDIAVAKGLQPMPSAASIHRLLSSIFPKTETGTEEPTTTK